LQEVDRKAKKLKTQGNEISGSDGKISKVGVVKSGEAKGSERQDQCNRAEN